MQSSNKSKVIIVIGGIELVVSLIIMEIIGLNEFSYAIMNIITGDSQFLLLYLLLPTLSLVVIFAKKKRVYITALVINTILIVLAIVATFYILALASAYSGGL